MRRECRHCGSAPVSRPRGLCWACYYASGVRDRYPPLAGPQGVPDGNGPRQPPAWPTDARPGTPAKLAVLCQRASRGWSLWHPGDA